VTVKVEPVGRRPVIAGISSKDRARLEANHRFAAAPVPSSADSVTGGNERIGAIAGDAADSPYRAAVGVGSGGRSPCPNAGWIIYRHSHQPAMKRIAVPHAPISDIKNAVHDGQRRSLLLDRCSEVYPVVCGHRLHVYGPAWIDGARVHA